MIRSIRSVDALQLTLVSDRLAWRDHDVELRRLIPFGFQLHLVGALRDPYALERTIEAVDHADVIAVHEDLRAGRLNLAAERERPAVPLAGAGHDGLIR